jgi:hypothetical protein
MRPEGSAVGLAPRLDSAEDAGRSAGFFRSELPAGSFVPSRDDYLRFVARGQRVIHIGCTDWPLTVDRFAQGDLLHGQLLEAAEAVLGVDIDRTGVELLRQHLGGEYLCLDVTATTDFRWVADFSPTLLMACDVIEHVPDVDAFVAALANILAVCSRRCRLVLTTPNALAIRNALYTAGGLEMIHPDHRFVLTPASLDHNLVRHGLSVKCWRFYTVSTGSSPTRRLVDWGVRLATHLRRPYGDGLLVEIVTRRPN